MVALQEDMHGVVIVAKSSSREGGYASEPVRLTLQDIMHNARFNATEEKPVHGNSVQNLLPDETTTTTSLSHTNGWLNLTNHRFFDLDSALDVFVDIEVPLPKRTEVRVVVGHNNSAVGTTRVTNQQNLMETRFQLAEELYNGIPSSFKFLVDGKLLERHDEQSICALAYGPTLTLIPTYTIQPVLKEVHSRSFEVAWMAQVLQSYEGISLKGATVEIRNGEEVEVLSETLITSLGETLITSSPTPSPSHHATSVCAIRLETNL